MAQSPLRFGDYAAHRRLGGGGMAEVLEAVHTRVGQRAAIKTLHEGAALDPQLRARLVREARLLARLVHPSIPRLYEIDDTPDGVPYLVMEFVEGETLRARLDAQRERGQPLPLGEALGIAEQIADVMAYAHGRGVLHRDLKPENLLLRPDAAAPGGSRVLVIDFGIGKLLDGEASALADAELLSDTLLETAETTVLGTPLYMSPEQAQRRLPSVRSDVYALGAVLLELLTGQPPFLETDAVMLVSLHVRAPRPRLRDRLPAAPGELDALLAQMLAQDPALRPEMATVASVLRRLREKNAAAGARSASRLRLFKTKAFGWTAGGLAVVALALTLGARARPGARRVAAADPNPRMRPPTPTPTLPDPPPRPEAPSILLVHPVKAPISEAEVRRVLPGVPAQLLTVAPGVVLENEEAPIDWAAAQRAQEAFFGEQLRPLLARTPAPRLHYFGLAPIPLAMHLGFLLGGLAPLSVYQLHHARKDWFWTPRVQGEQPPRVRPWDGRLQVRRGHGDVVVRVSTSIRIDEKDTRAVVPAPLAEIDIALDRLDRDALASPDEVTAVAVEFRRALDAIASYYPGAETVHVFASVPVGLALRLGTEISTITHRPIQTYQYFKQSRIRYQPAILLKRGEK